MGRGGGAKQTVLILCLVKGREAKPSGRVQYAEATESYTSMSETVDANLGELVEIPYLILSHNKPDTF